MPILGIDVGASKIYYVVLSTQGEQHFLEGELKFLKQTKETFLTICQAINAEIKKQNLAIEKVGVGLPGTLKDGTVTAAANFPALVGWGVKTELEKIFGMPVSIFNDAKAFIYAETVLGAGRGLQNVVGLTLGSGLGGGLVLGGSIYLGKGSAGEVGHEIIDLPNTKEAEDFVSVKFFQKFGKDPDQLRTEAENGDAAAKSAFHEFGSNLGVVIANLVNLLDPDVIVLGGGITGVYDLFINSTKETAERFIVSPESKKISILKSALGPAAGAIGAALLAGL